MRRLVGRTRYRYQVRSDPESRTSTVCEKAGLTVVLSHGGVSPWSIDEKKRSSNFTMATVPEYQQESPVSYHEKS